MTKHKVAAFRAPEGFSPDPLTDLLHQGARKLIAQAVGAALQAFLDAHDGQTDATGRRRRVWHGHRQYMLVITGADEWGNVNVLGLIDCFHESTRNWRGLLRDLKRRGLEAAPKLTVGDGAMGFRAALHEVCGKTPVQRGWVHMTANVLNAMPKSVQTNAKAHLNDLWMAETKAEADSAFDFFIAVCGVKYERAVKCLVNDRADPPERTLFNPIQIEQGPRETNGWEGCVLRFPGRTLEAHQNHEPQQEHFRPRPAPNQKVPRLPQPENGAGHDAPVDALGQEEVAQAGRSKPPARNHPDD